MRVASVTAGILMENAESQDQPQANLKAGERLRAAREEAGLSRGDVALRTKIAERHLLAIEEGRFGDLAAPAYAVGFARTYARALGLDETVIAKDVRRQLDAETYSRPANLPSFEPGDPARVPSRRLAWIAALGVIAVIAALLVFWSSYLRPEGALPSLLPDQATSTPAPAKPVAPAPVAAAPAVAATGPVVLTAASDQVWIKVTDASGAQVVQKELQRGEAWTVPDGVAGPTLRIGRPDALQITVGGRAIPPLSTKPLTMSGVSLAPADLIARSATPATPGSSSPLAAGPLPKPRQPAAAAASAAGAPLPYSQGATPPPPGGPTPLSTVSD
ncbi:hypothetical protein WSK_0704 [Novosphingobium sp. Rr 2-17]|uniref:helix-turn-helix domain-containing protein n=1 Tax=Novosphingobium sp. Rr 2-17 TaxID=555793 RepID=UPI0002697B13|nr:helix-turn-helix domain-containing protein [Novosphingobium sp. Rr 2-17]EIZ80731.1 hypothetical protein WSK_0704 [Novosphingobium sp. Rr 2-17]